MNDIDVVLEVWFNDPDNAQAFFASDRREQEARAAQVNLFGDAPRAIVSTARVMHDEFSFQPSTTQPLPFERKG